MLKGRGRDPRGVTSPPPGHTTTRSPGMMSHPTTRPQASPIPGRTLRSSALAHSGLQQRALPVKPEPDYEVVEFPSDQYVNAKLQPPPPPPPRPPTGHPAQAGASCGLCGGGGARVRCAECGRRALCASCDDMYHRHPKRRHHQRQALSLSQLSEDRPPLPPKVTAPIPPPRRNKASASPLPPSTPMLDQRRSFGLSTMPGLRASASPNMQHAQPVLVQTKMVNHPTQIVNHPMGNSQMNHPMGNSQMGSMPFLQMSNQQTMQPMQLQMQNANTLGHLHAGWSRPRGSMQGFNVPQVQEPWESPDGIPPPAIGHPQWGRPMRRGGSTLELGGTHAGCPGCAHCASPGWRYGSCAALDQPWGAPPGWPMQQCCPQPPHGHFHMHSPQTPQPYRRADSRTMSRTASRAGSRAASPAMSVRSRASRRAKHRSPSPALPSSDADSESESETETAPKRNDPGHDRPSSRSEHRDSRSERPFSRNERPNSKTERPSSRSERPCTPPEIIEEGSLGPVPPPPSAPWQCEHCTYVNEPGVRVCVICCRTPTAAPKVVTEVSFSVERLRIASKSASPVPERVEPRRVEPVSDRIQTKVKKERTSTGCGPSPPRENTTKKLTQRLVTPTRDQNGGYSERKNRHDMAVGPSPPKETQKSHSMAVGTSPPRESQSTRRSPSVDQRGTLKPNNAQQKERHSVSTGPSPPRESLKQESNITGQKKFVGTSPPRDVQTETRLFSVAGKTNVSNTGTSPPPQSISTQTYENPSTLERAPSAARSRPRRRFRDEKRERSHSRHSLSSDTRESDRSVRTTGAWEWRERDSSPSVGEWAGKLARRASHLDLRRRDNRHPRRTSLYGSEGPSPEPPSGRAISMEVLSGRNAERGLELARLLAEAERLGYSAAEVQVGLSQSPGAPLAWLRSRWAGLVGAVQGAASRLAPGLALSEAEARAALARHRGSVWPAVTDCVDNIRANDAVRVSSVGRVRGRVWGAGAGAEAEAAPRAREDSSDEFDAPPYDDWYGEPDAGFEVANELDLWAVPPDSTPQAALDPQAPLAPLAPQAPLAPLNPLAIDSKVALKLRSLLLQAGIPSIDENLLLKGLLSQKPPETDALTKSTSDFIQSENDFIDAYNALTRASPLPNISKLSKSEIEATSTESKAVDIKKDDENHKLNGENTNIINKTSHNHHKTKHHTPKKNTLDDRNKLIEKVQTPITTMELLQDSQINSSGSKINHVTSEAEPVSRVDVTVNNEITDPTNIESTRLVEEKSSNLNEIVDNTQKLIQQMKEEINSDIHSLDDGHSQTSRSDHDSSSHDEQESSYSESEEESNNTSMSSEEKEMSSSEDDHDNNIEITRNGTAYTNRTSSEDNEQFEEALDNLDNQIEDVKHANIEILDSIARSLQEEHTISIEVNEFNNHYKEINRPQENNETNDTTSYENQNTSTIVNAPRQRNIKRGDANNNIFVTINSFEEIYEELNTSKSNKKLTPEKTTPDNIQPKIRNDDNSIPTEPKIISTKVAITESIFKAVSPTRVIILDAKEPTYNAILENIEAELRNNIAVESATEVTHEGLLSVENNEIGSLTVDDDDNNSHQNLDIAPFNSNENINVSSLEMVNNTTDVVIESDSTFVVTSPISNPAVIEIAQDPDEEKDKSATETHTNTNKGVQSNQNGVIKQNSPEKISHPINGKSSSVKSNIPKPVRASLNNKTKNDKTAPKLLISKVPVRRGSLKQYHAPAPPKSHFGNVQSGHVKQLQSKVFNTKEFKLVKLITDEAKPSTSTASLPKKNSAPQPPKKIDQKQQSPKTSPPREKTSFFRETCRTEDEWTESDSDESQTIRQVSVEEVKPPSPPPPVTLRRVSGNLIDLARIHLPEGSPERQARMLLAEGATETWEQAHLAVELVSRGTELSAALLAALECTDLPTALAYLNQDCELCASRLPEHEMVSMLRCTHRCCRECAHLYFTVQITERSIADCVCPFCKMPELESMSEDAWLEYFAHLDIQLKTLLETDVHELFQRKLRDRTLAMDPNFKWCMECSSGFFVHPKQKKLRCPECRSVTCASCRKPWNSNHDGLSCEQYAAWLADNDPEISVAAVQQHLRENGLECPRCRFKYSLSRGGCMHFTCTQCKYEFCYGCGKPFTMGARCGLSDYCAKLGLHAHHPRNCLFYLRDKEPHELQTLLQMNNVTFETEAAEGGNQRCPIPLQRETPTGLVDGICGSDAPAKHAGLCKSHYVEYLAVLARPLDPIPIMEVSELVAELRRRALPLPERGPWDTDPIYAGMCAEIVKEKIPLD